MMANPAGLPSFCYSYTKQYITNIKKAEFDEIKFRPLTPWKTILFLPLYIASLLAQFLPNLFS